ncbi:ThiF family adenylyltransferase [Micromonospora phytophila]|uniref:ThiF family adenylyltransferase n=1 Tax=Micromonospora phytophila TaxID=709888 RepID=UPI00202F9940|nr:ThiF family adenylyltransferase [Micromonospora phytophila]MCM0673579.1 ThiF family adenylyltransferase [Micromonospora phytophila]
MSLRRLARSADLVRLRDEGYEMAVDNGHLVISHVPYVTPGRTVAYGKLISVLNLAGDVTVRPEDHVVYFDGATPCDQHGQPLRKVINNSQAFTLAPGITAQHLFSSKPAAGYTDYHHKMTSYIRMLAGHAQAIEPQATATTFPVIEAAVDQSVFLYEDTASSRAGISAISATLQVSKIAIVGLGGTGAYVLDLLAKTPVGEIHLFDGDTFLQHNAFRAPGAASIEELRSKPSKVAYHYERYSRMRASIMPHEYHISLETVAELQDMDFVFLTMEGGATKRHILNKLRDYGRPFIDVGLGVYQTAGGTLGGIVRVTTSTPEHPADQRRIPCSDDDDNDYNRNIQIADLNMLNAAMAVIKWKKLVGFYADMEEDFFSTYTIDGNHITNEDNR